MACAIGACVPPVLAGFRDPIQGEPGAHVDMAAPDGVVYPDFTYAGIDGGIPDLQPPAHKVFDVTAYGADPADNGADDTAAIQAAIDAAVAHGSGIVFLPEGHYQVQAAEEGARKGRAALKIQRPAGAASGDLVVRGAGRRRTIVHMAQGTDESCTFQFAGRGGPGRSVGLARDATRGDVDLYLARTFTDGGRTYNVAEQATFKPGDRVLITANQGNAAGADDVPRSLGRWWGTDSKLRLWGKHAVFANEVVAIEDLGEEAGATRLTLRQPIKIGLRAGVGAYHHGNVLRDHSHTVVQPANVFVERCGIEDMTLTYSPAARNENSAFSPDMG